MAQDIAKLGIEVDSSGVIKATKSLKSLDKQSGKNEKSTGKLKKSFSGLGVAIGALGIAGAFAKITKLAIEQEKAVAQVDAAIKSTGGSAGFTSAELQKMAASFQNVTNYGDESILTMQSVLLTFTKIQGDILPKTTAAVLDLSARMGIDLQSAAVQLGKALNDPIANLSALSRSGIQFSDAQKSTIKSLVETNKLAEAQTIILKELNTQFGGSAKAARDTFGGAIISLNNAFGDLLEGDGGNLNDAKGAIEQLTKILQDDGTKAAFSAITTLIIGITSALAGMIGGLASGSKSFGEFVANTLAKETTSDRLEDISERMRRLGGLMKKTMGASKGSPFAQQFKDARNEMIELGKEFNSLGGNQLAVSPEDQNSIDDEKTKTAIERVNFEEESKSEIRSLAISKDLDAIRTKYTDEETLLREKYSTEQALLLEKLNLDKGFQDEYDRLLLKSKTKQADDERKLAEKTAERERELKKKTAQQALFITDNLAVLMSSKSKEMFEVGKAAATASAIINTYEGATKAWAQGGIFGAIGAGAVIIAGMAQVSKIQSQQFSGGGGVSASSGGGAISSLNTNVNASSSGISSSGSIGGGGVQNGFSGGGAFPAPVELDNYINRSVSITLNGAGYSRNDVRDLIESINEELGDGLTLAVA